MYSLLEKKVEKKQARNNEVKKMGYRRRSKIIVKNENRSSKD